MNPFTNFLPDLFYHTLQYAAGSFKDFHNFVQIDKQFYSLIKTRPKISEFLCVNIAIPRYLGSKPFRAINVDSKPKMETFNKGILFQHQLVIFTNGKLKIQKWEASTKINILLENIIKHKQHLYIQRLSILDELIDPIKSYHFISQFTQLTNLTIPATELGNEGLKSFKFENLTQLHTLCLLETAETNYSAIIPALKKLPKLINFTAKTRTLINEQELNLLSEATEKRLKKVNVANNINIAKFIELFPDLDTFHTSQVEENNLANYPQIKTLILDCVSYDPHILISLAEFKYLQCLEMEYCKFSSACLPSPKFLSQLTQLKRLTCDIRCLDFLDCSTKSSNIEYLCIVDFENQASTSFIQFLANAKNLLVLALQSGNQFYDKIINALIKSTSNPSYKVEYVSQNLTEIHFSRGNLEKSKLELMQF